jgi:excisionase family DNA binding protein
METLLSVKQVAFILKIHPLTVRRYIKQKQLKALRVGGNIRIEESALQDINKEFTPKRPKTNTPFKTRKIAAKQFTQEDTLLRLQGRAAGLKLENR